MGSRRTILATKGDGEEWLNLLWNNHPQGPAKLYLDRLINKRIQEQVSPRLVSPLEAEDKPSLSFFPKHLLGCLWLQLARAITGNKQFRRCVVCQTFIEISTDQTGSREGKKTCSDRCRQKLSRERRAGTLP